MSNMIVICGPTATGKTDFALKIAPLVNGELISADSRQIYQGMDIGTGKDLPAKAHYVPSAIAPGYYQLPQTRIWLTDIVSPTEQFGSGLFHQYATAVIQDIIARGRTPILVGGTGFYINAVISPAKTQSIPPNPSLRQQLSCKSLSELQQQLQVSNPTRFGQMNYSDRMNPHRLIRAIEIAQSPNYCALPKPLAQEGQAISLGLTAPVDFLATRIKARVQKRLDQGFEAEVNRLLETYPNFSITPGGQTMGYQEWIQYLEGSTSRDVAITKWIKREIEYMKRQLTWFKKQPHITWFDITKKNWYAEAVKQLEKWM